MAKFFPVPSLARPLFQVQLLPGDPSIVSAEPAGMEVILTIIDQVKRSIGGWTFSGNFHLGLPRGPENLPQLRRGSATTPGTAKIRPNRGRVPSGSFSGSFSKIRLASRDI